MPNIGFTAPHYRAAEVGQKMLQSGASAIDAMVAAAATIAVVYPHMNSLGGDGFWLIQAPGKAPIGIDACGYSALNASPGWFTGQGLNGIPDRGAPSALCMAGTLQGWQVAREWHSSQGGINRDLAELLAPAAEIARDGFEVTASLQRASEKVAPDFSLFKGYQSSFCPGGQVLQQGDKLTLPGLAHFLKLLGERGLDDFYRGQLADQISGWLQSEGSPLDIADFHDYRAQIVAPLSVETELATLYNLPLPTQGIASLLILAIYDRWKQRLAPTSELQRVHGLVEATKQAFLVRDREVTDPSCASDRWPDLLSGDHIDELVAAIHPEQALPWPKTASHGDTIWMGAVDEQGVMVSFIQSIFWEFGSGLVMPDYDLVWNNRGTSFADAAKSRNALAPRRKPFHTLNPAFAEFKDGRRLSYGTMGGEGQPQTQSALFCRYALEGQPLSEAISAGRWLLGRTWGGSVEDLKLEADLYASIGAGLDALGHRISEMPIHSELMGHAGALCLGLNGDLEIATDPRSDGAALRLTL